MLFKLKQAEHARAVLEKHIEKAEKRKLIQMEMMNANIVMKNFKQKTAYMEHIHSFPICQKKTFKKHPYCQSDHMQYNHE